MNIISILIGLVLLLFGRRLFWFFVAAAGFAAGMVLARDSLQLDSEMMILAVALLAGVLGALLAFLLQKLAIAVAGFAGGGYLGAMLLQALDYEQFAWVGFLVGGIIGALLLLAVFEWALIGISALLGATLVTDGFGDESLAFPIFLTALVLGIVVQALQFRRTPEIQAPAESSRRRAT